MNKKVFVETYGCQMNVSDTELVKTILSAADYTFVPTELEADVVMLNTCSVRDNANRKVFNRVHEIRHAREKNAPVLVGVLGCMATNFRRKLLENPSLGIDFIAGPDSYKNLPQLIDAVSETGEKQFNITLSEFETYQDIYPTREAGGVNALISIMRGCNNYCTFCVVPHTRGRERSRDPKSILEEVNRLVSEGITQVTLLGQNVNSYRYEETDFTDLMAMVSDVVGLRRIRYMSPHPKDYPTKLLKLMAERDNICKQIHMPLQAGNNRVLEKMNRTYTREEFFALVDEARAIMPDVVLSTDIIVGFCTETAEEFEETMDVVRRVEFDVSYMFKYSERPNTLASSRFKDDVPEAEKTRRIVDLVALQNEITYKKNLSYVGKTVVSLVDKLGSRKDPNAVVGRTDGNTLVMFPGNGEYALGEYVKVQITEATPHMVRGVAIGRL